MVAVSIGFSSYSDSKVWARGILNVVTTGNKVFEEKYRNILETTIVTGSKPTTGCASFIYAYYVRKWKPCIKDAFHLGNICCLGRSLGFNIKGFLRRAYEAIYVTASNDERALLQSVHHSLYSDCIKDNAKMPAKNVMSFNKNFKASQDGKMKLILAY